MHRHDKPRTRQKLHMVEELLITGKLEQASGLLSEAREKTPARESAAELFEEGLDLDPTSDTLFEIRGRIYRKARQKDRATADIVRAVLVTTDREKTLELLGLLAEPETVELAPWMRKAISSVGGRLAGQRKDERQLLLEAIRMAPNEVALFAALARCELGSSSEVEIFALRGCVRLAPNWIEAYEELDRAASAVGDRGALVNDQLPPPKKWVAEIPRRYEPHPDRMNPKPACDPGRVLWEVLENKDAS